MYRVVYAVFLFIITAVRKSTSDVESYSLSEYTQLMLSPFVNL